LYYDKAGDPRTAVRRHPERAVPDEAAEILAAGVVAHVGFVEDGQPYVIPLLYHFDRGRPDRLWLHGSRGSRLQRRLRRGVPVCVSVALVDGLVASKDAQFHSANYRSVVAFGRARPVPEEEKAALFEQMTQRYFTGRTVGVDYASPTANELLATSVLEVEIEAWSAKARRGGPQGPRDDDPDAPGSAGVFPPAAA
jgi:nitroimidazol reductase NimA-like FMN-containing flavoprotein (pyridoxamine 5'-phosphate oxidase superfamily)